MSDVIRLRLRADADRIVRAAIAACDPAPLVQHALERHALEGRVHVLAAGKAAVGMLRAAYGTLPGRIASALAVAPAFDAVRAWPEPRPMLLRAEHPLPGPGSVLAARAVERQLAALTESDVLLALLSGGASALLAAPASGVTLDDLARTTRALLAAGADIDELNCVRKHLDEVKGGRLARLAAPARVLCLALSDVIGDDDGVIGSGPFAADPTTFADARDVLARFQLQDRVPPSVRAHLARAHGESVKPGDAALKRVTFEVIGSNATALEAARREAEAYGYATERVAEALRGEAREVGAALGARAAALEPASALIAGGETTVTVRGGGSGGRNQELALSASLSMAGARDVVLVAAGTDGVDGKSPAAGGVVDGTTVERLRATGIDPRRALELNDSYSALAAVGDALVTGPTGTNVMDLVVALRA